MSKPFESEFEYAVYICPHCGYCVYEEDAVPCKKCQTTMHFVHTRENYNYELAKFYNNFSPKSIDCLPEIERILDEHNIPHNFDKEAVQSLIDRETRSQKRYERYCRDKAISTGVPLGTTITCPYCKSVDVRKIRGSERIFSTGIFGLGSSKAGKQWHCNNCKSDF